MGVVAACGIFWSDRPNPATTGACFYRFPKFSSAKRPGHGTRKYLAKNIKVIFHF
jgi:hypothetical protein